MTGSVADILLTIEPNVSLEKHAGSDLQVH